MQDIAIEDAISIIQEAFEPMKCTATPTDHGNYLHVEIMNEFGEPQIEDDLYRRQFSDPARLTLILKEQRKQVKLNGYDLSDWEFPDFWDESEETYKGAAVGRLTLSRPCCCKPAPASSAAERRRYVLYRCL